MYRKCTTEISALHQRQFTQALLEMMRKMPFEDISVTALCEAAGLTRRVFYHLFSNKLGALHALLDHRIRDIDGYGRELSGDLLRFLCYWREQKVFLDALAENGMSGLLLERMISCVLTEDFDVRHWLKDHGWEDHGTEVVAFGLSGLMGLVYTWYYDGFRKPAEEMAALAEQLLWLYGDSRK